MGALFERRFMLKNDEVFARLGNWLSPGEITSALPKLLRVREAWDRIHDPDFLDRLIESNPDGELNLSLMIELSLELFIQQSNLYRSITDVEEHLTELVEEIQLLPVVDRSLKEVSILALALQQILSSPERATAIEQVLDDPNSWKSPLACAWPILEEKEQLLSDLFLTDSFEGSLLGANMLLANLVPDDAADQVLRALTKEIGPGQLEELQLHEPTFTEALFDQMHTDDPEGHHQEIGKTTEENVVQAMHAVQAGDLESAQRHLESAKQSSAELHAIIHDQSASLSARLGDLEEELNYRDQAQRTLSTPSRRATLALRHIDSGDPDHAKEILSPESHSIEEKIVAGILAHLSGNAEVALQQFQASVDGLSLAHPIHAQLASRLQMELLDLGEIEASIDVVKIRVENDPSDHLVLVELVNLLLQAGDPQAALDQAYLAYALAPGSSEVRKALAVCLEEVERPAEALAHWNELAQSEPEAVLRVANCALKAEFFDLAIHTAEGLIEGSPYSVEAKVLIGRTLCEQKVFEQARQILEEITLESPEENQAWIALADCFDQSGDHERAGQTLSSAIQLNPNNAQLKHAYSLWLEGQGRISEALDSATEASQLNSKSYPIHLTLGRLFNKLGHHDQALPILKSAVASKPFQWQGHVELAKSYEALQRLPEAFRLIEKLPEFADADSHHSAGQLALLFAGEHHDPTAVEIGKKHLTIARQKGINGPVIQYWVGLASELEGSYEEASKTYSESLESLESEEPELVLDAMLGIGRVSAKTGKLSQAISTLEAANEKFPYSTPTLVALSKIYLESEDPEQALNCISSALENDPTNTETIDQITKLAMVTQNWDPALSALQTLVDHKPDDPSSWLLFAKNAHLAGEPSEARQAMAKALSLGRHNPYFLSEAGNISLTMDRPFSAIRYIQRAVALDPNNTSFLKSLATTAEKTREMDLAQEAWIAYARKEPNDIEAMTSAAQIMWSSGRKAEAKGLWSKVIESDSKNASALIALAQFHIEDNEMDEAMDLLKKAILRNPEDIGLIVSAARLAIQVKRYALALSILENALRIAPSEMDLLLSLAECYYRMQDYGSAEGVLVSLPATDEMSVFRNSLGALISHKQGNLSDAISQLSSARSGVKSSSEEFILFTEAATALMQWADALDSFHGHDSTEELVLMAEAHARIRSTEAWAVFRHCKASQHGPPKEMIELRNFEYLDQLMAQLPGNMPGVEEFRIRTGLLTNPLNSELISRASSLATEHSSGELLEAIALAHLRAGEPTKAIQAIAIRDDYTIEGSWLDLIVGICQMKLDQFSSARQAFLSAGSDPILMPLLKYNLARISILQGELEQAVAELNEAVLLWPDEPSWQFQLGGLYVEQGNLDTALPHLQEAAENSPDLALYQITFARVLRDLGHISQAFEIVMETVETNTVNDEIWAEAGELALAAGNPQIATEWFDRAQRVNPDDPHNFVGSAKSALAMGDSKTALTHAKHALRTAPDDPQVLITAGEVLAKQGKIEKALDSYQLALGKVKDPLPIRIARSKLLTQSSQPTLAMSELDDLLKEHENNHELWAAYAEACEFANELSKGMDSATKAIKLSPNNVRYQLLLARISRKSGQLDHALAELARIEAKNPTNADVLVEKGKLLEERRELTDALAAYQRAIECQPNASPAYYRSGVILKQMKRYPEAGDMLRQAVEYTPNDPDLLHQLAAVRALELVHGNIFQAVTS
jgi:tetratricopeptide (TPR) repeat protein